MHRSQNTVSPTLTRIAWLAIGGFLLLNIGLMLLRLFNKPINPDEFQHLHIAWLVAQGKILYRDFWEHHGPFYSLFNGGLIYLLDAEPSLRILFWSRLLSLTLICGIGAITWFIARSLDLSRLSASVAIVIFTSLYMVQNKGVEMRPDIVQTLFWFAGLLMLLKHQPDGDWQRPFWAGLLFALCILSNPKAGIGPFFVTVFYVFAHWLCGWKWQAVVRDLLAMAFGGLAGLLPVLLYFLANDSLTDFLYFNFIWNVQYNYVWNTEFNLITAGSSEAALSDSSVSPSVEYFRLYAREQLPFTLLVLTGAVFWVRKLGREADSGSRHRNWLFAIVTIGTSLGWITNQHSQYFLIFLPLFSILAAYALVEIAGLFPRRSEKIGIALSGVMAIFATLGLVSYGVKSAPFRETDLLTQQKQFTEKFVSMTNREEPVGVVWSLCGGYMFNEITGFYWVAMPYHSDVIEIISGEHPYREKFISDLEDKKVRYVIGVENWMTEGLSSEAKDYLKANFEYTPCLWTKKEIATN